MSNRTDIRATFFKTDGSSISANYNNFGYVDSGVFNISIRESIALESINPIQKSVINPISPSSHSFSFARFFFMHNVQPQFHFMKESLQSESKFWTLILQQRFIKKSIKSLINISNYTANWDGFGAMPFIQEHLGFVSEIITNSNYEPSVSPTSRNSILLEMPKDQNKLLIEIFSDHFNYLIKGKKDKKSIHLKSGVDIPNQTEIIVNLLERFQNDEYNDFNK